MSINEWVEQYLVRPVRLLIVDEADSIAEIIKSSVPEYTCEFETVSTGEAALARVKDAKFDLIFIDSSLKGISCVDILKALKAASPETPVVVLTRGFNRTLLDEVSGLGIVSFLNKPLDLTPAFILQVFRMFKLRGSTIFNYDEAQAMPTRA